MKLTVNKKEFISLLQKGSVYAGKCKSMPILDSVKICVKNGYLYVVSSDSENTIKVKGTYIESDSADFAFCVNAKDIINYAKLIPTETFDIELDKTCMVRYSKGMNEYPIEDVNNFPTMKIDKELSYVDIDSTTLYNLVYDARNFIGTDEYRLIMRGIYFEIKDNSIVVCATDSNYMYTNRKDIDDIDADLNFVLNEKSFVPVLDMTQNTDVVSVASNNNSIIFKNENTTLIARKVEGKYPNFNSVIPKNNQIIVNCNKQELINSISRVSVASNVNCSTIKLSISGMNMDIKSEDIDFGKKGEDSILCSSNDTIEIGFKYDKLKTCLNAIITNDVNLEMNDAARAILLKDSNNSNKIVLLMPVLLK